MTKSFEIWKFQILLWFLLLFTRSKLKTDKNNWSDRSLELIWINCLHSINVIDLRSEKLRTDQMESQSTNSGSDDSKDSKEDNNKKQTEQNEDGICPICHNQITNRALTDTCLHQFCFECIRQWSRTRNECPFCRNVYHNITHNIRSETSFDQIPVRNPNQIQNLENLLENENAPVFMYQQIVQMRYYSQQLIARLNARLTQLDPNSIEFIETLQRIANAEQRIEEFDQRNNQLGQEFRNQRLRNNGQNQN